MPKGRCSGSTPTELSVADVAIPVEAGPNAVISELAHRERGAPALGSGPGAPDTPVGDAPVEALRSTSRRWLRVRESGRSRSAESYGEQSHACRT
jgi:hypothetical protein